MNDKEDGFREDKMEQLRAILREAEPDTGKINAGFARVETEARIISNLAWAVEKLLTCEPDLNSTSEQFMERVGDVARVIRERARTLGSAAKFPE